MTGAPLRVNMRPKLAHDSERARQLALEHRRLARHLADIEVSPYQVSKYLDYHRQHALEPRDAFDALLWRVANNGALGLLLADAYSGTLYRVCVLRAKLMLPLAILECTAPSFSKLDAPDANFVLLRMVSAVLKAALVLALACLCLGPAHLWIKLRAPAEHERSTVERPNLN